MRVKISCRQCNKILQGYGKTGLCKSCVRKGIKGLAGEKNPFFGKRHSKETREKISQKRLGAIPWNLGKPHSEEIKLKISLANSKKWAEKNKDKPTKFFCRTCGSVLATKRFYKKMSGLCSPCSHRGKTAWNKGKKYPAVTGAKHPNWKGGLKKRSYPAIFSSELRKRIRERDGDTCQKCGKTAAEELEKLGTVLSVNHIDYDRLNNDENNLNTLCRACNSQINYNRLFWTEFFQQYQTCCP